MGSFNTSCLITGDLIQDGDRIVAIILERQKDSFKRSYSNGSQDGYRIASFAIRGAYDSYGRCSDDSSENSKLKILNEIFKTDIFNNFLFIQTGMWDRKLGLNFNVFKYLTDKGIDNNQDANLQINFIHEDTYDLMIKMMRKNTDLDYDKKETYESFINNTFDEIENRILFINSKKNHKKYKESISILI